MDWVSSYLAQILMIVGFLALIVEVTVLGFSTFIFFFVGLAFIVTGFTMSIGLVDATLASAVWMNIVLTVLFACILWKPLKSLQNKKTSKEHESDFLPEPFTLSDDIDIDSETVIHVFSGIQWKVRSETPISAGTKVKAVKLEVGIMWVKTV
ncbi:MAG: NfeD family protein [Vibrio sp.]